MNKTKNCFVICPINKPDSDTRRRSNQLLKHIIKPTVEKLGYNVIRADEISEPGIITSQIIEHLINDELVIADLTDGNPNVYYELAVRHLVRKPTVHVIQNGQNPHFDVSAQRTIAYDMQDPDIMEQCKEDLNKQVVTVTNDPTKMDSPISQAIDTRELFKSNNPVENNMGRIIETLQDIKLDIMNLKTDISPSWSLFGSDSLSDRIERMQYALDKLGEKQKDKDIDENNTSKTKKGRGFLDKYFEKDINKKI